MFFFYLFSFPDAVQPFHKPPFFPLDLFPSQFSTRLSQFSKVIEFRFLNLVAASRPYERIKKLLKGTVNHVLDSCSQTPRGSRSKPPGGSRSHAPRGSRSKSSRGSRSQAPRGSRSKPSRGSRIPRRHFYLWEYQEMGTPAVEDLGL